MQIYTKNLIKTNSIRYLLEKYVFKMNKKLIRLTESDLHKVIKESVNKVLTELDWKTYANAAKKAREQGREIQDGILIEQLNEHLTNNMVGIILLGQKMKRIKISIHTMITHFQLTTTVHGDH